MNLNSLTMHGWIQNDAVLTFVPYQTNFKKDEQPLVTFTLRNSKLGGNKDPKTDLYIDVHFMKEGVSDELYPYLKKGKEIIIFGELRCKRDSNNRVRFYIEANYMRLIGIKKNDAELVNGHLAGLAEN